MRELDVYDRGYKNGLQEGINILLEMAFEAEANGADAEPFHRAAGRLVTARTEFLAE